MIIIRLFSKKWILSTILVMIGIAVLIRLGIWQLDRLEQRREFNSRVSEQIQQPRIELSESATSIDLEKMEYRDVFVYGEYDFTNQIALRNQVWHDQYGVNLITPLIISGSDQVVLVERGWIPSEDMDPANWFKYDEPGRIEVNGVIRNSQSRPDFGRITDPIPNAGEKLNLWNLINIPQIETQLPYNLLSIYISQSPGNSSDGPPFQKEMQLDLTEGPHLGYAIQWFSFAGILLVVYLFYVYRDERKSKNSSHNESPSEENTRSPLLLDQSSQKSSEEVV